MNQCLHITFILDRSKEFLHAVIQKGARSLGIEGTAQMTSNDVQQVKVIACGNKDAVEEFLDILHNELARDSIKDLEVEPFLKEKDFRGVFRVIE